MPKAMRPVVKIEDWAGGGHAEEGRQEEADAGGERQRRRVNDAGDAVSAEAGLMLRANAELQAQAIECMERTRVQGEELQRAKVRIAELAAEVKMRDEALQAKEAIAKLNDAALQSKETLLQTITKAKDDLLLCKDALLQAKDAEIRLLHADYARLSAQAAVAGAALPPAPAPAAARAAAASAEAVFQEGQQLYGEQRFSEAAERWGRAAPQQHGTSHAHLSDMLVEGRAGVAKDKNQAFELAAAGAALGCAHSKGALGRCYVMGYGVARDKARGLALGRESEAAGSCFGQYVVGACYEVGWGGVAQNYAEAVRLYSLAAAQGHADARFNLGYTFFKGQGVAQDYAEAVRLYSLAAAQGHANAQLNLGNMFYNGQGVAQDYAEAVRLYSLAAAQEDAGAQNNLGVMFENGQGVAKDRAEAIRLYRLAAAQGQANATAALRRLRS
jgi:TPR repeat protein